MTTYAIEMHEVQKRYPFFRLDNLHLQVETGQIMGFVGPNGAGKTTTMRLLMGMCRADSGTIRVLDHEIPEAQALAKADVGFVSHDMSLFGSATFGWHMAFVRSIYPGWDDGYANTLLKRFYLRTEQLVRDLSTGQQLKAALLLVLARRPRLLVLDEPTSGLDPVARHEVLGELMEVVTDEERAVLFSSHNTVDVEQISDQITFIDRGRIVESGDKEAFLDRWRRIRIEVPPDAPLHPLPGITTVIRDGRTAVITTNSYTPEVDATYSRSGARVLDVQRLTLEEIFVATVMHSRMEHGE